MEKQVERTLRDVAPKGEETIIPGAIYVGIAGMGGSIIARNRISSKNPLRHSPVHNGGRDMANSDVESVGCDWTCGMVLFA